ncbi:hypothetical protein RQM47_03395 [Rubrivirga sp. S365]|uniref:Uncharacterized protein n=1 Tax=Rubrivirga litoralis TaxID=3075598 RepID=A0ABU3BLL7_9BACT|nr:MULTISPECIES: hypothetical protein [unclassified Rubrivirga]MDT0630166.1 hypothetical protein [Rubrivirga sp. F394]MDT7855677.1 hypothetical protein [Rubrivirga sp. S365]
MRRLLPALALVWCALPASAQDAAPGAAPLGSAPRLYVGVGALPGVGVVAFGTAPVVDVFTRELVLYADYVPRVTGGAGRLETAVGLGGAVRALRIVEIVRDSDPGPLDLDLGLRIGPSFYTAFFEQSAESRSRAFSVMLDPFARGTLRLPSGRVVFAELGAQSPSLRVGLSTALGAGR